MDRSKLGQLCGLWLQRAYQHAPRSPSPLPRLPSTRLSAAWESLVGPTASLTPLTIVTSAPPRPPAFSSILRTRTIQTPTLIPLSLTFSPTIGPRSALESLVSIPASLPSSPHFSERHFTWN